MRKHPHHLSAAAHLARWDCFVCENWQGLLIKPLWAFLVTRYAWSWSRASGESFHLFCRKGLESFREWAGRQIYFCESCLSSASCLLHPFAREVTSPVNCYYLFRPNQINQHLCLVRMDLHFPNVCLVRISSCISSILWGLSLSPCSKAPKGLSCFPIDQQRFA